MGYEEILQKSIPDVKKSIAYDADIETILALEKSGMNRTTLIRWLENKLTRSVPMMKYGFVPDRTFKRHMEPDSGWIRFGLAGDTHLVNNYHDNDAWSGYIADLYREGITAILHCGDLWDGATPQSLVYPGQQMDVPTLIFEKAMDMVVRDTPDMGIKKIFITGNHDTKIYERTGVDAGQKMEDRRRQQGKNDFDYLQPYYARVELSDNPRLYIDLIHLRRNPAYSIGYALQTYLRNVPPRMRSHILGAGHTHKQMWGSIEDETESFLVGGFQKPNSYTIRQRKGSARGGWIVEVKLSDNSPTPIERMRAEFLRYG